VVELRRAAMTRLRRDESGAILVLTVISLVVMLGLAALVVDAGLAYGQRRGMQRSADSSALGAAQDLASANTTGAVSDAIGLGNQNLPNRTVNWNGCANDQLPPGFTADLSHNCISFDSSLEKIRVRVPRQTFPSLFGGIIGVNTLSTSTVAIAGLLHVGNGGGLEPFAIDNAFGAGDYCLDSGGNGNSVAPCDGATTGNFGLLAFADCGINTGISDDIAAGADHVYVGNPVNPNAAVLDPFLPDDCVPRPTGPNTVLSDPGNRVGQETPPMLTTSTPYADGKPARLQRLPANCGAFSPAWETVSASCGTTGAIDNRPLWEFIPNGLDGSVPVSCHRETFNALLSATPLASQRTTMHAAIQKCITDYATSGSTAPVFTANTGGVVDQGLPVFDLQESPRFVYVPQMLEATPINGRGTYHIKTFRAVFVQRTGANNSPSFFEPGPWNGNTLPDDSAADITGFVFPARRANCTPTPTDSCGTMLPGALGSIGPTPVVVGANAVVQLLG
jgi:hypothetical protein